MPNCPNDLYTASIWCKGIKLQEVHVQHFDEANPGVVTCCIPSYPGAKFEVRIEDNVNDPAQRTIVACAMNGVSKPYAALDKSIEGKPTFVAKYDRKGDFTEPKYLVFGSTMDTCNTKLGYRASDIFHATVFVKRKVKVNASTGEEYYERVFSPPGEPKPKEEAWVYESKTSPVVTFLFLCWPEKFLLDNWETFMSEPIPRRLLTEPTAPKCPKSFKSRCRQNVITTTEQLMELTERLIELKLSLEAKAQSSSDSDDVSDDSNASVRSSLQRLIAKHRRNLVTKERLIIGFDDIPDLKVFI